jgi:hypothetical protein
VRRRLNGLGHIVFFKCHRVCLFYLCKITRSASFSALILSTNNIIRRIPGFTTSICTDTCTGDYYLLQIDPQRQPLKYGYYENWLPFYQDSIVTTVPRWLFWNHAVSHYTLTKTNYYSAGWSQLRSVLELRASKVSQKIENIHVNSTKKSSRSDFVRHQTRHKKKSETCRGRVTKQTTPHRFH